MSKTSFKANFHEINTDINTDMNEMNTNTFECSAPICKYLSF